MDHFPLEMNGLKRHRWKSQQGALVSSGWGGFVIFTTRRLPGACTSIAADDILISICRIRISIYPQSTRQPIAWNTQVSREKCPPLPDCSHPQPSLSFCPTQIKIFKFLTTKKKKKRNEIESVTRQVDSFNWILCAIRSTSLTTVV